MKHQYNVVIVLEKQVEAKPDDQELRKRYALAENKF